MADETSISFLADFGHAKHFFPDADVFPSILVAQRVSEACADQTAEVCIIPRDDVPRQGLEEAVVAHTFSLPQKQLQSNQWVLERPDVTALLRKLEDLGCRLGDLGGGTPLYGIKTGLNEAYLVDTATRDRLISEHGSAAAVIRPYARGKDIGRWSMDNPGLWMILMKSSENADWAWSHASDSSEAERIFSEEYPSLHNHLKRYESYVDVKTGARRGLRHREDQGRFWWELRSCSYYSEFDLPKTLVKRIAFYSNFYIDEHSMLVNDSCLILPTTNHWLLSAISSPIVWYYMFKTFPHKKDEALSLDSAYLERLPIPNLGRFERSSSKVEPKLQRLKELVKRKSDYEASFADWLRLTFDFEKLPTSLDQMSRMDESDAIAAILAAFPRRSQPGAADLARIRKAFQDTISPAHEDWLTVQSLERELSDLVNATYGLTEEDIALMWRTAPPRMPFYPK